MLLRDYLRLSGQTHEAFGNRVSMVPSAISMLCSGERKPSWRTVFLIERVTEGQVTVLDWAAQIRDQHPDLANANDNEQSIWAA